MAFVMTKDIETGNAQIDKEHKELFAKINAFVDACGEGRGQDEILKTVEFLKTYTKTHFLNEESLQKKNNYPDYISHKNFHEQFIKNIDSIIKELKSDGISVPLLGKINMQIGASLITHIKTADAKLAKFLKEGSN